MDDTDAGGRDVLGPAGVHRLRAVRIALAAVDVGHRRGVDDEIGAPSRLAHRVGVGHVELGVGRERRTGQVVAQREPDLAAGARHENVGTSSQSSPGFLASRSLTTGSASICHGIPSVGSFQATPCSSLGSYSPVTQ